jgi:hypothetical protein
MWRSPGPCSLCCSPASPSQSPAGSTSQAVLHISGTDAPTGACIVLLSGAPSYLHTGQGKPSTQTKIQASV